jgi:hypothetical protein
MKELQNWEIDCNDYYLNFVDGSWAITLVQQVNGYSIMVHSQLYELNKSLNIIDCSKIDYSLEEAKLKVKLLIDKVNKFGSFI